MLARLLASAVLAFGVLGLAAAVAATPVVAPEKANIVIGVGGKSSPYYLPLTIAETLGYFREEGVNVRIVDFPGGAKALQALVGGSVDVVSGAFDHTLTMQSKGIALQAFVSQGRYPGMSIGLTNARAASYKSPADLRGLKIGVTAPGSASHMALAYFLAQRDVKPNEVSIVGIGSGASAVAAVRGGLVDGLSNIDPAMTMLEGSGDITVIADGRTAQGTHQWFGGPVPAACLYAPAEFIRTNSATVQALTNAMVKALRWLRNATPDQVALTVPRDYLLGDSNLYKRIVEKTLETYWTDGSISPAGAQVVLGALKAFDPNVRNADIKLTATFTNEFVEKAWQFK